MKALTFPVVLAVLALPACASQSSPSFAPAAPPVVTQALPAQNAGYAGEANVEAACPVPDMNYPGAPKCYALLRTDAGAYAGHVPSATKAPDGYGPSDIRSAYNLPSTGGKGQTVGIVDFADDPNAESDLAVYRKQYGLPACTTQNGCFHKVNQFGNSKHFPKPRRGWAGEISIDLDMASATCPQCHILLVEAGTSGNTAENEAVTLGSDVVSNSWGYYGNRPRDKAFDHPGHVILVASGDTGYQALPTVPDSFRTVVSVGGTDLHHATNARGWTETAWRGSTSEC
ncbi:MAG TPA: hypothetical protein VGF18_06220, partial [Candidatus Tumulicola sp.]